MPSTNTKSIRISYFHRSQKKRARERKLWWNWRPNISDEDNDCAWNKRDREKIIRNMYFFHFMKLLFNNHISWYFPMEVNERLQKCLKSLDVCERNFTQAGNRRANKEWSCAWARRASGHINLTKTHCKMIKGETATATTETTVTKKCVARRWAIEPMQCRKYQ